MFLAGILSSAAFLTRFTLALFPASVIIYLIYKKEFKSILAFALGSILPLIPWMLYNQVTYHDPIWDFKAQYGAVDQWNIAEPAIKQITNFYLYVNMLVILFCIIGLIYILKKIIKKREDETTILGIYIILCFIYYTFIAKLKDARYILSFLPFIFIVAFIGINTISKRLKKKHSRKKYSGGKSGSKSSSKSGSKLYVIIILVILAISAWMLITVLGDIHREYLCDKNSAMMQSIKYLDKKIPVDERDTNIGTEYLLSNAWVWYGYYLNIKANSLWSPDLRMLIDRYAPKYIAYDMNIGNKYNQSLIEQNAVLEAEFDGSCNSIVYLYKVIY